MINPTGSAASHLYSSALGSLKPSAAVDREPKPQPSDVFRAAASDFYETLQTGEQTSKDALGGKADPASVVQALAASEVAIETAVAVRNKVVEAYQEILRMPV